MHALPNLLGQRTGKLSIFLTYVEDALPLVIFLQSNKGQHLVRKVDNDAKNLTCKKWEHYKAYKNPLWNEVP